MRGMLFLGLLPLAAVGCGTARYVQKDAGGGVIAMPSGASWHRKKADELMLAHVGPGYQVVEEREVVTGQATTNTADTQKEPTMHSQIPFLPAERQTTTTTTTTQDVTEWQITYRRGGPPKSDPQFQQTAGTRK
jgi:hypothetical protein